MKGFALAVLASFLLTATVSSAVAPHRSTEANFTDDGDAPYYHAIALGIPGPFADTAPYVWRPAVPLFIRALTTPLDNSPDDAARLLAFVALWAAGLATYLLARTFDFAPALAMLGLLLFYTLKQAAPPALGEIWRIDSVPLALIPLTLIAIKCKWDMAFMLLLVVGVLVKETLFFVMPVWFAFNTAYWQRGLLLVAPAIIVTIAIRLAIPHANDYSLLTTIAEVYRLRAERGDWNLYRFTFGTFGPLLALPFVTLRATVRFIQPFALFIVLVYAQMVLATDTERLLIVAYPVLILCVLNSLRYAFAHVHAVRLIRLSTGVSLNVKS